MITFVGCGGKGWVDVPAMSADPSGAIEYAVPEMVSGGPPAERVCVPRTSATANLSRGSVGEEPGCLMSTSWVAAGAGSCKVVVVSSLSTGEAGSSLVVASGTLGWGTEGKSVTIGGG